jgi:hypothetical protein
VANESHKTRSNLCVDRRNRLLSRALYYSRGTTFYSDSVPGLNGLPVGTQGRRETDEEKWRHAEEWGVEMNLLRKHPLCIGYFFASIIVGIIWQVGFYG